MIRMASLYRKRKYIIKKYAKFIRITALLISAILFFLFRTVGTAKVAHSPDKGELSHVSRVVDGDTIKLSDGRRIRLIGVDTPELHYSEKLLRDSRRTGQDIKTIQALGKLASDFTTGLCRDKNVRLELDVRKLDRYGRTLAYVYLEDGTFVNARILEEGYGQVMTIPPDVKYSEYFLRLEKQARKAQKGLWSMQYR